MEGFAQIGHLLLDKCGRFYDRAFATGQVWKILQ